MRKVIGVTGGIASGKSFVASILEEKGFIVIDADKISREVVAKGSPILSEIKALFGDNALNEDETLNRAFLRSIIFSDKDKKEALEALLHPAIKKNAQEKISSAFERGVQTIFYMAPLLIEANATDRVDEIWVVALDESTQLKRLMNRDQIDMDSAVKIVKSQMPLAEKLKYAAEVIDNSKSMEETKINIEKILERKKCLK